MSRRFWILTVIGTSLFLGTFTANEAQACHRRWARCCGYGWGGCGWGGYGCGGGYAWGGVPSYYGYGGYGYGGYGYGGYGYGGYGYGGYGYRGGLWSNSYGSGGGFYAASPTFASPYAPLIYTAPIYQAPVSLSNNIHRVPSVHSTPRLTAIAYTSAPVYSYGASPVSGVSARYSYDTRAGSHFTSPSTSIATTSYRHDSTTTSSSGDQVGSSTLLPPITSASNGYQYRSTSGTQIGYKSNISLKPKHVTASGVVSHVANR